MKNLKIIFVTLASLLMLSCVEEFKLDDFNDSVSFSEVKQQIDIKTDGEINSFYWKKHNILIPFYAYKPNPTFNFGTPTPDGEYYIHFSTVGAVGSNCPNKDGGILNLIKTERDQFYECDVCKAWFKTGSGNAGNNEAGKSRAKTYKARYVTDKDEIIVSGHQISG